jgi:hypothetical protein
MCLACGEVACCDSSVGRHANAHYVATRHPVMRSANQANRITGMSVVQACDVPSWGRPTRGGAPVGQDCGRGQGS